MNYHNILHDDMLNGEGLRVVLFVSGCSHHCPNCQNPQTHPLDSGIPFTDKERDEIFYYLSKPYIKGITFSGGDPLHKKNAQTVFDLCKKIKIAFPEKDIWVYTGYLFEELSDDIKENLKYVDVLVDGKFKKSLFSPKQPYVGSSNQRIIDIKRTYEYGEIKIRNYEQ